MGGAPLTPSAAVNRKALAPGTDRCLAILELLSLHPRGLTLSEIHRELGVSKNMVFRVLGDLAARGYAWRTEGKSYVLGRKLLELAVPRVGDKNLVDEAAPEVRALRDACGEGAGLLVPSGAEAVLVYFQPSRHPVRTIYDLGLRIGLHSNAPGKVFLAFGDEGERRERLRLQTLRRFNARTITDRRALEAHLEQARRKGYTVDHAEELEGIHCVAAPVYDSDGRLVAAVVLTGPSERIPASRLDGLGRKTAAAAARITERLRR
jgi:DNA-binding IclR family transcriptional regulator